MLSFVRGRSRLSTCTVVLAWLSSCSPTSIGNSHVGSPDCEHFSDCEVTAIDHADLPSKPDEGGNRRGKTPRFVFVEKCLSRLMTVQSLTVHHNVVPACVSECGDAECGDDGCGNSCGECDAGYSCAAEEPPLCVPDCETLCGGSDCGRRGKALECLCGKCSDGNSCTIDLCESDTECVYLVRDGLLCPHEESCDGGGHCVNGSCVPDMDSCCADDTDCSDGNNACTFDSCWKGVCQRKIASLLPACCNEASDCAIEGKGAFFVPGCVNSYCVELCPECCAPEDASVFCDDGKPCTCDICGPTGCQHLLPTEELEGQCFGVPGCCWGEADCDDGLAETCDLCHAGECQYIAEMADYVEATVSSACCTAEDQCEDENQCTAEVCFPGGECRHIPLEDGALCDDEPQYQCKAGLCECVSQCDGQSCGPDWCGGSCGDCPEGHICHEYDCVAVECDDGNLISWDGCTHYRVSEFLVNIQTERDQVLCPGGQAIAALGASRYLVVWSSSLQDGGDSAVVGRAVDLVVDATEHVFASSPGWALSCPVVESLPSGGAVAIWNACPTSVPGESQEGTGCEVFAQLVAMTGAPVAEPFQVNMYYSGDQRHGSAAALNNGTFVVMWTGMTWGGQQTVSARLFDDTGFALSPDIPVAQHAALGFGDTNAVAMDDSSVLLFWMALDGGDDGWALQSRVFGSSLQALGSELQANPEWTGYVGPHYGACRGSENSALVAWRGVLPQGEELDINVYAQFVGQSALIGSTFALADAPAVLEDSPSLAALADGTIVAVWRETSSGIGDSDSSRIAVQWLTSLGETAIPVHYADLSGEGSQKAPAVASLNENGIVVAWQSCPASPLESGQDGDGCGIFAQRFDGVGAKVQK